MCFQLLEVVALDNRAQFLGADAIACCLDIRRDCVFTLGSKTCRICVPGKIDIKRKMEN
jgi:hypothetical protein